jgi:hypothetical protein
MIRKTVKTPSFSLQIKLNYYYLHSITRLRRQQKAIYLIMQQSTSKTYNLEIEYINYLLKKRLFLDEKLVLFLFVFLYYFIYMK